MNAVNRDLVREQWGAADLRRYKQRPCVLEKNSLPALSAEQKAVVDLVIAADPNTMTERQKQRLVSMVVAYVGFSTKVRIPIDDVHVDSIGAANSTRVRLSLPKTAANQLVKGFKDSDPWLKSFLEDFRLLRLEFAQGGREELHTGRLTQVGSEPAIIGRKTVVELDLVGYSDISRIVEENVGVEVVAEVNAQIQGFVDTALRKIEAKRQMVVVATTGDGAILAFDNADDAHRFAVEVHRATQEHNARRSISSAKRWFRIGIATGDLYQKTRSGGTQEVAGTVIATAVRLEAAARAGEIVVDASTFGSLPSDLQGLYGPKENVQGKRNEQFAVNRFSALPGADKIDSLPTVPSVLELFDRLNPRDQLGRVMLLVGMPIQHRPPDSLTLFRRQDAIVDWAVGGQHLGKLADCLNDLIQRQKSPLG